MSDTPKHTPPSPEVLTGIAKQWRVPLYERISVEALDGMCNEIGTGMNTLTGAASRLGVARWAIWSNMKAGEAAAKKAVAGDVLSPKEKRALWFFTKMIEATGKRELALTSRALGVGPKGGSNKENRAALEILRLTCYRDLEPPPEPVNAPEQSVEPTRAQREAWVRREAAALGLALTEPPGSDTP
jgi:hypothetical protein